MISNISSFIKNKPALAVGFLFSVSSLLFGIWVASIPGIKYRLGFSDGSLGLSLLLSPLGAITGMLISAKVFSKIQVGKWLLFGYIITSILMVLQINSVNRLMFWICLYFFGLVSFLNGVSTNATVNIMEKKWNTLMMSTCHAMYSLGGAVSAGIAALLFTFHISSGWQIVIVVTTIIIVIISNKKHLLTNKDIIHSGSKLKLPSLTILGLSFICMVSFMAEGCVADWSAIYFKEVLHSPKAFISLGYAGFSCAMTLGRFNGDALFAKFGNKKLVISGSLLAAAGFLAVVLAPAIPVAIAGYILVGFGCCCTVPILFRASANIPNVGAVEGFAMITTGGLIGFLTGPSIIGFISEEAGLSKALSLLIIMTLLAGFAAWKNKFLTNKIDDKVSLNFDEQLY
ncbi:MFS transporter [Ferruginibacter albus]|uniref:MFS transporter n=1 Tax=Ferruginibacter albus TaxID=2875540 RepID=UPI001CC643D5|nr:MFS transporter [Ferruginibacter albus]UAY51539.1 MFS transporter [Ferruginibacter albus]